MIATVFAGAHVRLLTEMDARCHYHLEHASSGGSWYRIVSVSSRYGADWLVGWAPEFIETAQLMEYRLSEGWSLRRAHHSAKLIVVDPAGTTVGEIMLLSGEPDDERLRAWVEETRDRLTQRSEWLLLVESLQDQAARSWSAYYPPEFSADASPTLD